MSPYQATESLIRGNSLTVRRGSFQIHRRIHSCDSNQSLCSFWTLRLIEASLGLALFITLHYTIPSGRHRRCRRLNTLSWQQMAILLARRVWKLIFYQDLGP